MSDQTLAKRTMALVEEKGLIKAPSREVPCGSWEWSEDAEAEFNNFFCEAIDKALREAVDELLKTFSEE